MSDSDKVNILVVDDLPEKLLVLQTVLQDLGENVVSVRCGEEALRQVLDHEFAVILLDVNMPGMDGYETAALIRRRRKSAHTPIIFVTAYGDELHTAQGYSLGAVDYVLSPVVPEILRTKVKVFVDLFRMTQQVRRQADERVALAQEQAARAAAEEGTRRSNFLAEASKVLSSSLDLEATLRELLRLVVPQLADLGAIVLTGDQGQLSQAELVWVESTGGSRTWTISGLHELHDELGQALKHVLAAGEPECLDGIGGWPVLHRHGEPGLPAPNFELRSALILPLLARGRALGVLLLALGPSPLSPSGWGRGQGEGARLRGRYNAADRALAEDLAGRAAIAIDNAQLYRDIQEADRRKNEFLSMLAHELRNPLAPILTGVQVMRLHGQDKPELEQIRDMIERQVRYLVRMVDDLLDVSRITRGKIRLQLERVDVAGVVSRAVEVSRPLLDARKQELTVALPPQPVQVQADPIRLAQVLTNLLNNAAKYTPEGGRVWLTVAYERSGSVEAWEHARGPDGTPRAHADGAVAFRVRDTGIGIPAEMLSAVFDLFTQVERSLDRSQGGLGIGLTLVRRLVEMHGGSVRALSAGTNQGSEFVVRLPALESRERRAESGEPNAEGAESREPRGENRAPGTRLSALGSPLSPLATAHRSSSSPPERCVGHVSNVPPHRVLVVDDNVDVADMLATMLRLVGHEVHTAHDGPAALAAAEAFVPEVVLLDIGLPRMDGYEVARRLRQQTYPDKPLLIAVTGYGQEEDLRRSQEAGFDHHVIKPASIEALMALFAEMHQPAMVNDE